MAGPHQLSPIPLTHRFSTSSLLFQWLVVPLRGNERLAHQLLVPLMRTIHRMFRKNTIQPRSVGSVLQHVSNRQHWPGLQVHLCQAPHQRRVWQVSPHWSIAPAWLQPARRQIEAFVLVALLPNSLVLEVLHPRQEVQYEFYIYLCPKNSLKFFPVGWCLCCWNNCVPCGWHYISMFYILFLLTCCHLIYTII